MTTPARGCRRTATASPPTTCRSTATSARSCSTSAIATTWRSCTSCSGGQTSRSRTSSRAGWPSSASTTSTARQINPALVYLSISGFGTAEGAWLPGYDLVVQAVSGLMSLTGEPDGPAYRAGISVFDVITGLHGAIGVLAALRQRAETGARPARRGQPALVGALGAGQPERRLHGGRRRARADGQRPPERLPVPADADARPRHHHHRRQRPPVPFPVRGARDRRGRRRRAVPSERRPHDEPRRAAPDPRRPARRVVGGRPVRRPQQGRCAVRSDQLDPGGRRARRAARARTSRDRGRG